MNGHNNELEDQIPMLRELDKLRVNSEKFCDEGLDALKGWLDDKDKEYPYESNEKKLTDEKKTAAIAIIVKAFCERSEKPPKKLIEYLKDLKLNAIVESPHSVLDAALVMQALVAVPDCAFTKPVFLCLYWVVREIYSVDYPDYGIGGARASPSGLVSAFTTSECVSAILDFRRVHRNTAIFFKQVDEFKKASEQLDNNIFEPLKAWSEAEKERLALACCQTTQRSLSGNLAFRLDESLDDKKEASVYLNKVAKEAKRVIENTKQALEGAQKEITKYRKTDERDALKTEVSHTFALRKVLDDAKANADEAANAMNNPTKWDTLETLCKQIDIRLKRLLDPTKHYLPSALNCEVAEASAGEKRQWDPCEMAFAAASHGALTKEWDSDHRLERAVRHLAEAISDRGMFLRSRPIHVQDDVMTFVCAADMLRAFAQILQHMRLKNNATQPELVSKMLCFFKDTREQPSSQNQDKKLGWHYEYFPNDLDPQATAKAVLALARINEMLDEQINHLVLGHFKVKRLEDLEKKPDLDQLFYPDYGLRLIPKIIEPPPAFQSSTLTEWPEKDSFQRDKVTRKKYTTRACHPFWG